MNIDEMQAGREVDALIHVRLFGASVEQTTMGADLDDKVYSDVPQYSTDIAAAWQIVERLTDLALGDKRCTFTLHRCDSWNESDPLWGYEVRFGRLYDPTRRPDRVAWASDAPLAICRAALKCVGECDED